MDRHPGDGSEAGDEPAAGPGLPGGAVPDPGSSAGGTTGSVPHGATPDPGPSADDSAAPGPGDGAPGSGTPSDPDPGLAGFGAGGVWDSAAPSAALGAALAGAAGEGWRCEGGSRGEIVGAVRAAAALESLWSAAKLGLIRAAIRADDDGLGGGCHGDLPDEWSKSLTTEVALALAMSPVSAENLMRTAWDLGALLPAIGALLEDGTLTYPKARAVSDALELLSEEDKARAEAMIAPLLGGKTFGQVDKIAARAAVAVDPDLAERAREHAERNRARVALRRERSGAASLGGYDLPPAETLAAHAATCARARLYKDSKAFPGVFTDQLRAMAYLDLINQISRGGADRGGPAGRRAGRAGGGRVPGRAGAGRPGRARPAGQRRLGLPVRRLRRPLRAPRRRRPRRRPRR